MASSYFSSILDNLMGASRNLAPDEKPPEDRHWSDPEVCKHFICGFCPHDLFTNTRMDLGTCPNVHDERLRQNYKDSPRYGKMNYEEKFLSALQNLLSDCEKKIQKGYERLENGKRRSQEMGLRLDDKTYKDISDQIERLLAEIAILGRQGKVDQAQVAMTKVDELQKKRDGRENGVIFYGQDKEMEICLVCGAFTLVNDTQHRIDDHMQGRQHVGFKKIREQVRLMTETRYWTKKPIKKKEEEKPKVVVPPPKKAPEEVKKKSHRSRRTSTSSSSDSSDDDSDDDKDSSSSSSDSDRSRSPSRSSKHSRSKNKKSTKSKHRSSKSSRSQSHDKSSKKRKHTSSKEHRKHKEKKRR